MTWGRCAVILAAGASQRMGTPKASLPWAETTLLQYAIDELRAVDTQHIVVVLGPTTQHLSPGGVTLVFNPEPETGRSASIRIGAAAVPDEGQAVVIQSVDQPVPRAVHAALYAAMVNPVAVAIPTFRGRRGHPVCFAGRLLPELRTVTEQDQGLRAVVRAHAAQVCEVEVDSESITWNLNDPAAYAAARARA